MSVPGKTKAVTLSNSWQRLGYLYNNDYPTEIREGANVAQATWLQIQDNEAQIAFADSTPVGTGHKLNDSDFMVQPMASAWIKRAWLKNSAAGSNAVAVITPVFGG